MKRTWIFVFSALFAWSALAADVYVVTDAKGNRVYTDRPDTLPAAKVTVSTGTKAPAAAAGTTPAGTAAGAQPGRSQTAKTTATEIARAEQLTAEDLAKRCADARRRYEVAMNSSRLYEVGPDGARRYLTAEEIDSTRANAKQTMDTFCSGQ